MKSDLQKAILQIRVNDARYSASENYYRGNHALSFATQRFKNAFGELFKEFADNLCPAVVDAVKDKLRIENFLVEEGIGDISEKAWRIWQSNRMGKRAGEVHKEALKNGDSYVIVWVDAEGNTTIYPQKARNCCVSYDAETPGKILWAAKWWRSGEEENSLSGRAFARLNLYYQDRIEKYISREPHPGLPDAAAFNEFEPTLENPYGVVPVFHFANNADIGEQGISELNAVMPLQDALNKSVLDMIVTGEFASYRQRYATGIEVEYDELGNPKAPFMAGIERLWTTESKDTKFGDFEVTDLKQFLEVQQSFRTEIASVSGTPLYYLSAAEAQFPSGEALQRSESRFTAKVLERQESFGQIWEDVISFALLIEEGGNAPRIFTKWAEAFGMNEKDKLQTLLFKKELGVDNETLLTEAGYGIEDISRILAAKDAEETKKAAEFNAA